MVKGNLLHERVHSDAQYSSRGKKVYTNLDVWNDELGIYGKTDCVEFVDEKVTVVEYKPTLPNGREFNEDDAIQVFAQKLCVDEVFSCNSEAVIYYSDSKKRVSLPFASDKEYYAGLLNDILNSIRDYAVKGYIPPITKGQKCSGCSIKDICLPSVKKESKKTGYVRERIFADTEVEQ